MVGNYLILTLGLLTGCVSLLPLAAYALPLASVASQHLTLVFWGFFLLALLLKPKRENIILAVMYGLMLGAIGNSFIAIIQVLIPPGPQYPSWLFDFIMPTTLYGRAVGNIGQPNHVASFILMGAAACGSLFAAKKIRADGAWATMIFILWGLVLTGSRTGLVNLIFMVLWALLDRNMPRNVKILLLSTPFLAALLWGSMELYSIWMSVNVGKDFTGGVLNTSGRGIVWKNCIELIMQNPWTGVGWGNFNFAWMLTPFSERPTEIFDHAHNIFLNFLVELGLPLGGGLIVLLLSILGWATKRAFDDITTEGFYRRGAICILFIIGLHSQVEYPLWYPYFLWPVTAVLIIAIGFCGVDKISWDLIKSRHHTETSDYTKRNSFIQFPFIVATAVGVILIWASMISWWDYMKISPIYSYDGIKNGSLQGRIARGQSALWYHAYADLALLEPHRFKQNQDWDVSVENALKSATHHVLHLNTMSVWSYAYYARGKNDDIQRAKYIAARLREFKMPGVQAWYSVCEGGAKSESDYQCYEPTKKFTWRDFY